jgi:hypothetical protein
VEHREVLVGVAFVAGPEPAEIVEVGEGAFDDPALAAESGAVCDAALGDHGFDAAGPEQASVLVEVIAAVGQDEVGLLARSAGLARDRPSMQCVQEWDQLGDVVAVSAGQRDGQRDAGRVDDQVVL